MSLLELISSVLMVIGTGFVVLAVAGILRFGDVFSRLHASTKAVSLGVLITLLAAAMQMVEVGDAAKVILAGVLLIITAPVSSHMVARAAYAADMAPDDLLEDHLADLSEGDIPEADAEEAKR